MNGKNKSILTMFLMIFLLIRMAEGAQAYTYYMDEFSITRGAPGSPTYTIYDDHFTDIRPAQSGTVPGVNFLSGTQGYYYVFGSIGPENSGKLVLDSAGAIPGTASEGTPIILNGGLLLTNITNSPTLSPGYTFSVKAVFDLVVPTVTGGYAVQLTDGTSTPVVNIPDDQITMQVGKHPTTGVVHIEMARLDSVAGTFTTINEAPLDTNHDKIALMLTRGTIDSNAVTGSFYYIDNGIPGPITTFTNTADIFHGENFTRAQFIAFTTAPEPATMLLLGCGLAGLVGYRRKAKK